MQEKLTVDNASKGAAREIKKIREEIAQQVDCPFSFFSFHIEAIYITPNN